MNKDMYSLTQRPEVQKVYTTQEIAFLLDISEFHVRNIVSYYKIEKDIVQSKSKRIAVYSYDNVRLIKQHWLTRKDKKEQQKIKPQKTQYVFNEADHPLVKDKRCLDFKYWPDVVPDCFKECEK